MLNRVGDRCHKTRPRIFEFASCFDRDVSLSPGNTPSSCWCNLQVNGLCLPSVESQYPYRRRSSLRVTDLLWPSLSGAMAGEGKAMFPDALHALIQWEFAEPGCVVQT